MRKLLIVAFLFAVVPFSPQGIHPYIHDFTVVMNGQKLAYMNAVVVSKYDTECDFQPLDLRRWKSYDEVRMRNGNPIRSDFTPREWKLINEGE
ncbi:MAG: hypothetical protein K6E45_05705 [Bacteroidaceae bacterium]|nr:hypothetical protein [Bacteroidaceae bacterium]